MKDKIEILGMKELNKGNLIATASIKVRGIIINQMRIIQLHKNLRVDVPLLHWVDRGGHYYEKAIELNNELLEEIEVEVLYEYSQRKQK
jgi:hypothetical protein